MKRTVDVVGLKFGKLLVLEEFNAEFIRPQENRKTILKLKCQCECGTIVTVFKSNILYRRTKSCKRCQNAKDLVGKTFGTLTVLKRELSERLTSFLCQCSCGNQQVCRTLFLTKGKNISCDRCLHPKKYAPPKKSRKESMAETNYLKHIKAKKEIIGKRNGRLKIVSFSHWEQKGSRRRAFYNAKCKCGTMIKIRDRFAIKSCGCLHKDSIPKGEDQSVAKLTNSQVKAIREFKNSGIGYTGRQLGEMFGVSESLISSILRNKTYKET